MKNNYSRFFAIIKSINDAGGRVDYKELVKEFTNGAKTLKDLTIYELQELERRLMVIAPKQKPLTPDHLDKTRKAIISQFRSIGKTAKDAIAWAERFGVAGNKKKFNDYTGQELYKLLMNARKIKDQFYDTLNKP